MIAKYTPSIAFHAGDTFAEIAGTTQTAPGWYSQIRGYTWKRGATVLATLLLKDMARSVPTTTVFVNSSTPLAFYVEEYQMAAVAVTMTNVTLDGDTYNFQFGPEGTPKTLDQLEAELSELQSSAMAEKIQRVMAYVRSNGGANMNSQIGVACTIDFQATNPISFSN